MDKKTDGSMHLDKVDIDVNKIVASAIINKQQIKDVWAFLPLLKQGVSCPKIL